MRAGDFEAAWAASDRIRARGGLLHDTSRPRHLQCVWDGSDLRGRRVLIRCYHGLGDTIQFIRYAPLVRAIAREVIVWAQPELLPLLRTVPGIDQLLPLHDGAPEVRFDADVEVMELPYVFRTTLGTMPRQVPYFSVPPVTLEGDGLRVGIAWRAGTWDERRTIPFELLRPLLAIPGVSWYRLQRDAPAGECDPQLRPVDTSTVVNTAGAIRDLDLVLSIDSMPAHLAGALGAAVWTLLPSDADWRWLHGCDESPWYPTMRVFRQSSAGDWRPVVDRVRDGILRLRGRP
jgi:hypothetical protein